jgi:hypothetical protein
LLYFDRAAVTQALVEALNRRGPRERMIEFLIGSPDSPVAQIKPLLLDALRSENADARGAAVKGLALLNVLNQPHDPEIFAPLAGMLADPVASVRHQAAIAVGGYADERALRVLRAVVADTDPRSANKRRLRSAGWLRRRIPAARRATTRSRYFALSPSRRAAPPATRHSPGSARSTRSNRLEEDAEAAE